MNFFGGKKKIYKGKIKLKTNPLMLISTMLCICEVRKLFKGFQLVH